MSELPPIKQSVTMDSTDYKAGIYEINRQIRVLDSGFKAAAAGMEDWGNTADGLGKRNKSLAQIIELQKQKVGALQAEYQKLAASGNASEKELQELQVKINKASEELNKNTTELRKNETALDGMGKEAQSAGDQTEAMGDKAQAATGKTNAYGKALSGIGVAAKMAVAALALVATAALAAAGAMGGIILKSADLAGELVDMGNKTGFGVEKLQELQYIGDQIGVPIETVTSSLARLTRTIGSAAEGSKPAVDAFERLGVAYKDGNGELRDTELIMQETLAALGNLTNETERDTLAMEIFGRSALEINPLIKTSAEEMAAMTEEARRLGAVVDEDTVMALEGFGDSLAGLKAGLQGTMMNLAAAMLPGLEGVVAGAKGYMTQLAGIVGGSGGDYGKMAGGLGKLLGQMFSDFAKSSPAMMNAGLGIIQGIIAAVLQSMPQLLPAALTIIQALVDFLVQYLPMLMTAGMQIVTALVSGLLPMVPTMITAGLQLVLALIQGITEALPEIMATLAEVIPQALTALMENLPAIVEAGILMIVTLAEGLAKALPTLMPMVAKIIPQVVTILVQNLPLLITAALQLILALANGLVTALPALLEQLPALVQAIVDALIEVAPLLIIAAVELITVLAAGLVENIPLLLETVIKIGEAIVEAFRKTDWRSIGVQIIEGIQAGFDARFAAFLANIKAKFQALVAEAKKVLQIKSPSMVFQGIGENIAAGVGVGFGAEYRAVERGIREALGGLGDVGYGIPQLAPAMAGSGGGAAGMAQAEPIQITINVGTIGNELDLEQVARQVADQVRRWR